MGLWYGIDDGASVLGGVFGSSGIFFTKDGQGLSRLVRWGWIGFEGS